MGLFMIFLALSFINFFIRWFLLLNVVIDKKCIKLCNWDNPFFTSENVNQCLLDCKKGLI